MEIALAKHCGDNDIITPLSVFSEKFDSYCYAQPGKNHEKGYYHHIIPRKVKKLIGKDIWNEYFKFTVVRNPWDLQVSYLWWALLYKKSPRRYITLIKKNWKDPEYYIKTIKNKLKKLFKINHIRLLENPLEILDNSEYCFTPSGAPLCDFYISYENIEEDYRKVCGKLGIPYEKLPFVKNKLRKDKKHYSKYYNNKTKLIIAKKLKKQIEYFNYKFEEV